MKFEKLALENFSSYRGKHQIEFHTSTDKPVTIIVGGNGKGKTSIFDAINWALYGTLYESILEKENQKSITDYVNETALKELSSADESLEMSSALQFEHESQRYRIEQELVVKQINGKTEITDRASSLYKSSASGNWSEIKPIDSFLNEILPSNVRDYFLFNGDRINKLSLPGSSEEIRDGIYRVVDLELLQNGSIHLFEIAKKFGRSAKASSEGEVADIENQYSQARDDLDDQKEKLANASEEKRALETKIEKISAKLSKMDETKELQSKRDILKERLKNFEDTQKDTIAEMRSTVAIASMRIAFGEIEELGRLLEKKREKGEIPSSISESLLKDILALQKCICGTEFKEGDHVYKELKNRLDSEIEKQVKGNDLLDLYFELEGAKSEIKKAQNRLSDLESKRVMLEKNISEIDSEYSDVMHKLTNVPDENISKLAENLQKHNSDLSELEYNIQVTKNKIREKEEQIRTLQIKRGELGAKQENVRKFQLRDNLAQKAAEELEIIFQKFAEDSRLEIQEYTSEEFVKFIPTAKALKIGIDSAFHYDVRDQIGNPALQQLSNGQKQALSLAYITSISRVSEKNPPLVIDMPFGRLDEDVQDNIAQRLPDLASQVILLVLPGSEWNKHTQSILKKKASDIYTLEFDNKNRQTTITRE